MQDPLRMAFILMPSLKNGCLWASSLSLPAEAVLVNLSPTDFSRKVRTWRAHSGAQDLEQLLRTWGSWHHYPRWRTGEIFTIMSHQDHKTSVFAGQLSLSLFQRCPITACKVISEATDLKLDEFGFSKIFLIYVPHPVFINITER